MLRKIFFFLLPSFFLWNPPRLLLAAEEGRAIPREHVYAVRQQLGSSPEEKRSGSTTPIAEGHDVIAKDSELQDPVIKRKRFNQLTKGTPRIYKVGMRSDVVYQLQTALGYVSTIDLPEPALKVFIGDQDLFKVGVYEREVLIKPITDYEEARTNLTIYTSSGRLTFDVTVGPPETADFVLDFRLPEDDVLVQNAFEQAIETTRHSLKKEFENKKEKLDEKAQELAQAKLKSEVAKGTKTVEIAKASEEGDIRVNLITLSTIGDKAYLRFGVRNLSNLPYKISKSVMGIRTYGKNALGLKKNAEGLIELPSEVQIQNPVPAMGYVHGVLVFQARPLGKGEKPVLLLFEEDGKRNLQIEGFKWIP